MTPHQFALSYHHSSFSPAANINNWCWFSARVQFTLCVLSVHKDIWLLSNVCFVLRVHCCVVMLEMNIYISACLCVIERERGRVRLALYFSFFENQL